MSAGPWRRAQPIDFVNDGSVCRPISAPCDIGMWYVHVPSPMTLLRRLPIATAIACTTMPSPEARHALRNTTN